MKKYVSRFLLAILASAALPCGADDVVPNAAQPAASPTAGAVFVMTNATDPIRGNEVVMYDRQEDGSLSLRGYFPTGGLGSGPATIPGAQSDSLGSQGSLIASSRGRWLFAANAGSDEISVFRVHRNGLTLMGKTNSGGAFPISLTLHRNVLYVLNAGGDANITGFRVGPSGNLTPIDNSTRSLQTGGTNPPFLFEAPAQVQFSPKGSHLIATVKDLGGPGQIHVFLVDKDVLPSQAPVTSIGGGELPFAFTFDRRGRLLITEIFGRVPEMATGSAVSSYTLSPNGQLQVISDSVANFQGGSCWIIPVGRYAYVSNTFVHTISGYEVADDGSLSLLDANGVTATTNGNTFPTDMGATRDRRFLYLVQPGTGKVAIWKVEADGSLTPLGEVGGLEPSPPEAPPVPFSTSGGSPAGLAIVDFTNNRRGK